MILGATSRVTVVGYDVGWGRDSKRVFDRLAQKVSEGIDVLMLVNRAEEKPELVKWAREQSGSFELCSRPKDVEDPKSSLHAKCVLVDGRLGLFGSANLSYHGLRRNFEIGVLVVDPVLVSRADSLAREMRQWLKREVP